ncbi:auxin efflux carrier component 1-like [Hibiscus syriacus]|uniref:Auxin efflux carrier component 1-like n=1 Tax=Hibiscus syriacus TaxID=106335 RepID=A0A6A2Z3P9_HIBSY|nr:auxin efflux carrier component 1-like [Hibiscus syriacus]
MIEYLHAYMIVWRSIESKSKSKQNKRGVELKTVYDHNTFSKDDKMGDAEFDIRPYVEALKQDLEDIPSGTTISRVQSCRTNCLSEESAIKWIDGKVVQNLFPRLRNVECGELEIELNWIDLPGSKGV